MAAGTTLAPASADATRISSARRAGAFARGTRTSAGFAGGFGRHALGAWGEDAIKAFVHEAVNEALKLEAALVRLPMQRRVAVLHYAPIAATVVGEPPEIFPFLGSSRLEEPLNRYPVVAVFHGHAHAGSLEGRTSRGVPVYNVALPVLQRAFPNRPPFRVVEIPAHEVVHASADAAHGTA